MRQDCFFLRHRDLVLLAVLSISAFALRLWGSWSFSFSNDELSALIRLDYASFHELIDKGIRIDGHPAATQIFLFIWTKFVGVDEFLVRLPFLIFSALAVPLFYSFARDLYGRETALNAAIILTFSALYIVYGRIARPYSMGLFFITMQLASLGRLRQGGNISWWLLFALSASGAALTHHFAALTSACIALFSPLIISRKQLKGWIIACLLAILLYLPHLRITLDQLALGGVGEWLGKPKASFLQDHLSMILNGFLPSIIFISFGIVFHLIKDRMAAFRNSPSFFLLLISLTPLILGFAYSVLVNPVLQHSVLTFSSLAIITLLARALDVDKRRNPVLSAILTLLIAGSLAFQPLFRSSLFGDFKMAAMLEKKWQEDKALSDSTLRVLNINNKAYIEFYLKQKAPSLFDLESISSRDDLEKLSTLIRQKHLPYLSFHNLRPELPEVYDLILSHYPVIAEDYRVEGSRSTLFSQKGENSHKPLAPLRSIMIGNNEGWPDSTLIQTKEFSENLTYDIAEKGSGHLGRVSVFFRSDYVLPHELVAVTEDSNGKMIGWYGMKLEHFRTDSAWCRAFLRFPLDNKKIRRIKTYIWNPDQGFMNDIRYKQLEINLFHAPNRQGMELLDVSER